MPGSPPLGDSDLTQIGNSFNLLSIQSSPGNSNVQPRMGTFQVNRLQNVKGQRAFEIILSNAFPSVSFSTPINNSSSACICCCLCFLVNFHLKKNSEVKRKEDKKRKCLIDCGHIVNLDCGEKKQRNNYSAYS